MTSYYPTATIREDQYGITDGEAEIGKLLASTDPEFQDLMEVLIYNTLLLRQAGCQKFGEYALGKNQGSRIDLVSGVDITEEFYQQGNWVNITSDPMGDPIRDVNITNLGILGCWRWGARIFRVAGVHVKNMTISGVEEEHGWYINLSKTSDPSIPALVWDRVLVENVGSQVLQIAYRPHETNDQEADTDPETGPIVLKGCVFKNFHLTSKDDNGNFQGGKRPAQTLNLKATPNDVFITDTIWDNTAVQQSYGCLSIEGLSNELDKLKGDGSKIDIDATHRKLVMNRCQMYTAYSQQKPMWATDIDTVWMENCHIESDGGKEPIIDLKRCRKIHIKNCTGNVDVYVDGTKVGDINQDYDS